MDEDESSGLGSTLDFEARAALVALDKVRLEIVTDLLTFNRRKRLLDGMLEDTTEIKNVLGDSGQEQLA